MTHDNVTDIVERLNCLHVWPQFVADEHADVILPRQSKGLYDVGHVAHEAADTIATLRKQLENAREALRVIAEGDEPRPIGLPWRNDGKPSKHDRCKHGAWMYNGCEECTATFAAEALKGRP